jgi:hypothetical protein
MISSRLSTMTVSRGKGFELGTNLRLFNSTITSQEGKNQTAFLVRAFGLGRLGQKAKKESP